MKFKKPKEKKIKPIKVKMPKKKMPKEIASTALLWIIAAICLGVAIPLHFRFPSFSWQWVVFVAVFVISPFALLNFKCYVESKNDFTQEQIKNANVQFSKMVFGIWFWDCVYMVFFNHWKIASFILGAIGVIKVFYSLAINFVGRNKKETFFDLSMIFDFPAGTALAVYLIYLIPDPTVQTIVTTIVAAMFGGLLTLVGVAWTIRRQDTIRQEEEIKSAIPYLQVFEKKSAFDGVICHIIADNFPGVTGLKETVFYLKCVSNAPCIFVGVKSQVKSFLLKKQILANGDVCQVVLSNFTKDDTLKMICEDSLGNYYSYDFDKEKIEIGLPVPIKEEDLQ